MKSNKELMRQMRKTWEINPRTRVHDNNIRRDKKKMRREGKKAAASSAADWSSLYRCPQIRIV